VNRGDGKSKKAMKLFQKIAASLLIVGAGIAVYLYLNHTRVEPERTAPVKSARLVEVTQAKTTDETVTISAMGTVVPAQKVELAPEVTGRIVAQNKNLVPGGRIGKGKVVVRINPGDFDLALDQHRANVSRAAKELAVEQGRKTVAEREWNLIKDDVQPTEQGKKLALREVHLQSAEAEVKGAKSRLRQAEVNRSRTVIKAPFNALVTDEFVDVGQLVGPSTRIATLVSSDEFWVRVSIPVDRLPWIQIPDITGAEGSPVRVSQHIRPGLSVTRKGKVIKLLGELDPQGQMARLIVRIMDPLGLKSTADPTRIPLLIGAHVNVEIEGPAIEGVIEIPRRALRENSRIWIMGSDSKLSIRQIEIVWIKGEAVFVRGAVKPGEKIITNRISTPVEGLLVTENGHNGHDETDKTDAAALSQKTTPAEATATQ
jgi:RND family efflux transporter MFP subunit